MDEQVILVFPAFTCHSPQDKQSGLTATPPFPKGRARQGVEADRAVEQDSSGKGQELPALASQGILSRLNFPYNDKKLGSLICGHPFPFLHFKVLAHSVLFYKYDAYACCLTHLMALTL